MENKDIRWRQRFQNMEKAVTYLDRAINIINPDITQKAGIIHFFEMSFELAWNTMKDYLEEQGFNEVRTPRAAIKKAFEIGLIDNGHKWIELLEDRNITSHTYDEKAVATVEELIRFTYYPLLMDFYHTMKSKQ